MTMTAEQTASSVWCDQCGLQFAPQVVETPTADGGAKQSFDCPHCFSTYLVCSISARGVELRGKLREAQALAQAFRDELAGEITSYGS